MCVCVCVCTCVRVDESNYANSLCVCVCLCLHAGWKERVGGGLLVASEVWVDSSEQLVSCLPST